MKSNSNLLEQLQAIHVATLILFMDDKRSTAWRETAMLSLVRVPCITANMGGMVKTKIPTQNTQWCFCDNFVAKATFVETLVKNSWVTAATYVMMKMITTSIKHYAFTVIYRINSLQNIVEYDYSNINDLIIRSFLFRIVQCFVGS